MPLPPLRVATVLLALGAVVPLRSPLAVAPPTPVPASEPGPEVVRVLETRRVFPDGAAPAGVELQDASNNLDVTRHDGRVWLAFRTAPSHFASARAGLYVVSSDDERTWRLEGHWALGRDLREPRLFSADGELRLYASTLGSNPLAFEPGEVRLATRGADGPWSDLTPIDLPGRIAWRVRRLGEATVMLAYRGGEHLYRFDGEPMQVELLTSIDGARWSPLGARGAVYEGGATEADAALDARGDLWAVGRDEAGDAFARGSIVCRAPAEDRARWSCARDVRKFDSPLVFTHGGEIYLLARRTTAAGGVYDVGWGQGAVGTIASELRYSFTGKRCSLFRIVRDAGAPRVAFVLDLPSRGDTCFPAMVEEDERTIAVYDYSSDVDGPDVVWNVGQRSPTHLYRHVLRFEPAR
jgi:hypothetical protein